MSIDFPIPKPGYIQGAVIVELYARRPDGVWVDLLAVPRRDYNGMRGALMDRG